MKKLLTLLLVVTMLLSCAACGGNKKDIIGTWKIVDTETETEYGFGLQFTKDGKLRYGLTEDMLASLSDEDWEETMEGLDVLMSIEYDVKSDTEMEVTVSALFGLAKESTMVPYELDGDTLVFDGATYTRMKQNLTLYS